VKRKADRAGRFAYLPDGQKVWIEYVANGLATVRRVGGKFHRNQAVCPIAKLQFLATRKIDAGRYS